MKDNMLWIIGGFAALIILTKTAVTSPSYLYPQPATPRSNPFAALGSLLSGAASSWQWGSSTGASYPSGTSFLSDPNAGVVSLYDAAAQGYGYDVG